MWIWWSGHLEISLARLWNGTPANSHSSENIFPLRNKMTFLTMLRYQGQTFYGCTKHRSTNGAAWCKTTEGLYEDCQPDCQAQHQAQCRWSVLYPWRSGPGRQCWIQCLPGTTEEIPTKLETSGWKIATPALASRSDFSIGGDNAKDWGGMETMLYMFLTPIIIILTIIITLLLGRTSCLLLQTMQ